MSTKILIVEDEGLIALDVKKRLEGAGYAVLPVVDSRVDALLAIEQLSPSLVLMDIQLHGEDGIEIADQIRQRFQLPVLFLTAHSDPKTLARLPGPLGYIAKPFQNTDFRLRIEMALWNHATLQKLRETQAWLSRTRSRVSDALIATDADSRIAFLNEAAAELTGWDGTLALGKPLADVFPLVNLETKFYKLRGRKIEAEMFATRDHDRLLGFMVVFRDITDRADLERVQAGGKR